MTNWRKHISLKKIKYFNFVIFLLFVAISCTEKKEVSHIKPIASVDNVNLSKQLFDKLKMFRGNVAKDSEEIVNDWIEEQVYINEAKNRGLLNKNEYKTAEYQSSRQLAKAILFDNIVKNLHIKTHDYEIKNYYLSNQSEFILNENAYIIDQATFDSKETALKFREIAIKKNWQKAEEIVNAKSERNKFITESSLPNGKIIRALRIIPFGEISPVLRVQDKFLIFIKKKLLQPNQYIPLNIVKNDIKERLTIEKKVEELNKVKKEIFRNHKIEVFGEINE